MKSNKEQNTKGGKRKGAGRKPAPYKTTTISFRVREEWAKQLTELVKERVAELKEKIY
jgi:hypothetical protein